MPLTDEQQREEVVIRKGFYYRYHSPKVLELLPSYKPAEFRRLTRADAEALNLGPCDRCFGGEGHG